MTAITATSCGCSGTGTGSGCGGCSCGASTGVSATTFIRPHFFAGQLLTDEDLEQLTVYVTGKQRFRNRMLFGPGVVSGLDVACAPCGGGSVTVRPGYALDCCGNEIVVACPETVSVTGLVRDLRNRGLGADCGDPCDDPAARAIPAGTGRTGTTGNGGTGTGDGTSDQGRRYGLYIRYAEVEAEPVSPYSTQEPCPPAGCVASRIREGYSLQLKCPPAGPSDHLYRPEARLLAALGDLPGRIPQAATIWSRGRVVGRYRERMRAAAAAPGRVIVFTDLDAGLFVGEVAQLQSLLQSAGAPPTSAGEPAISLAREMTEAVRGVAALAARFDTYPADAQERLRGLFPVLGTSQNDRVGLARELLAKACEWLTSTVKTTDPTGQAPGTGGSGVPSLPDLVWPDPVQRAVAGAVVRQTRSQVLSGRPSVLGQRMLALGAPLDRSLAADLRQYLRLLREWLLVRLESSPDVPVCDLRAAVSRIVVPAPLPVLPDRTGEGTGNEGKGGQDDQTAEELGDLARIADAVYGALYRFVADRACAALLPPVPSCTDTDVLLAVVEVDDCEVTRICTAGREQALPGGSGYGAWYERLPRLRELAGRVCCQPVPKEAFTFADPLGRTEGSTGKDPGSGSSSGDGVSLPYAVGWLVPGTGGSPLENLLAGLGVIVDPDPGPVRARIVRPARDLRDSGTPERTLLALQDEIRTLAGRVTMLQGAAAAPLVPADEQAVATEAPAQKTTAQKTPAQKAPAGKAASARAARKQAAGARADGPAGEPEDPPGGEGAGG